MNSCVRDHKGKLSGRESNGSGLHSVWCVNALRSSKQKWERREVGWRGGCNEESESRCEREKEDK